MPLFERVRSLFNKKGEDDKKITFLSERRAALTQQRDRLFEDMASLEQKESGLRDEFKNSPSAITKRRLTSQLLQLRKDIERRQQLLAVLGQQVNVVSTHLHNLELVKQGQTAKLPDNEAMTADAVKAEEMLAGLEADNELAGSVGAVGGSGMSTEEQALFEELEAEARSDAAAQPSGESTAPDAAVRTSAPRESAGASAGGAQRQAAAQRPEPRRNEPEAT
jgi:hypothetical protein